MNTKTKIFYILILFFNLDYISSVCIQGDNCPNNQGICKGDICVCLDGYKTLKQQNQNQNQVFCDYKQISKYISLALEIIIPGLGLLYMGRAFQGIIKFAFIYIIMNYIENKDLRFYLFLVFLLFYIIDLICISHNVYLDEHGFPLL